MLVYGKKCSVRSLPKTPIFELVHMTTRMKAVQEHSQESIWGFSLRWGCSIEFGHTCIYFQA